MKPFLKWVGGKGQLLEEIRKYYPFSDKNITKYAEPFVGGGAVLFDILETYSLKQVYISDMNPDLVNTYQMIRDHKDELLTLLEKLQKGYIPKEQEDRKAFYLQARERFNLLRKDRKKEDCLEIAGLMIFLNRTCFNGLFRVNKKGDYNVPMGVYKAPLICDVENITAVSKALEFVEIVHGDYRDSRAFIDENTFVYIDPPYRPLTVTSAFTSYTHEGFDDEAQKELAKFVDEMTEKGAKIVVSNSDPKNVNEKDTFFEDIYQKHFIHQVKAARMVNSKGSGRGKISELLISNFEPE